MAAWSISGYSVTTDGVSIMVGHYNHYNHWKYLCTTSVCRWCKLDGWSASEWWVLLHLEWVGCWQNQLLFEHHTQKGVGIIKPVLEQLFAMVDSKQQNLQTSLGARLVCYQYLAMFTQWHMAGYIQFTQDRLQAKTRSHMSQVFTHSVGI